jgi:hypothetical protein
MQDRRVVSLPGTDGTLASSAVAAGGLIFVSAQGPVGADGKPIESDITAQTKAAIARLAPSWTRPVRRSRRPSASTCS